MFIENCLGTVYFYKVIHPYISPHTRITYNLLQSESFNNFLVQHVVTNKTYKSRSFIQIFLLQTKWNQGIMPYIYIILTTNKPKYFEMTEIWQKMKSVCLCLDQQKGFRQTNFTSSKYVYDSWQTYSQIST